MHDLALAAGPDGRPLLHAANCPAVRAQAARGEFVGTMLGCERLPDDIPRHTCLSDTAATARSAAG